MFDLAKHPQTQQCRTPLKSKMEQSYQLHDDQPMMSSRSCDEFTYNWLHNVETRDSLITPRSNPQTNNLTEQYQYPVTLDTTASYLCNSIGQLQGSYEVDVADGVEIVNVFLVETQIGEQQHATVRWINRGRERFPDQYIFEDLTQFKLCSKDGVTEAVMVKGKNIEVSVEWIITDGFKWTWRRTGDLEFDMASVNSLDPSSRRCSVSSAVSSFSCSSMGWNNKPTVGDPGGIGFECIRPELSAENYAPLCKVTLMDREKYSPKVPRDIIPKSIDSGSKRAKFTFSDPFTSTIPPETKNARFPSCIVFQNENDYFKNIMKMCSENLSAMNWIMKWNDKEMGLKQSKENYQKLSHGRVWVTVRFYPETEDAAWRAAVNELKGVYQQTENESEVYLQSAPLGSNLKRRRLRSSMNLWIVELQNGPSHS